MARICTTEAEKEDCWIKSSGKFDLQNETLSNKQTNKNTLFS